MWVYCRLFSRSLNILKILMNEWLWLSCHSNPLCNIPHGFGIVILLSNYLLLSKIEVCWLGWNFRVRIYWHKNLNSIFLEYILVYFYMPQSFKRIVWSKQSHNHFFIRNKEKKVMHSPQNTLETTDLIVSCYVNSTFLWHTTDSLWLFSLMGRLKREFLRKCKKDFSE